MSVTIHLYATFRQAAGIKDVALDLPPAGRVCDLLETLCGRFPALRTQLFDPQGKLYGHIHVFVNKRDITFLPEGSEYLLKEQDTLDIFPPVGGG